MPIRSCICKDTVREFRRLSTFSQAQITAWLQPCRRSGPQLAGYASPGPWKLGDDMCLMLKMFSVFDLFITQLWMTEWTSQGLGSRRRHGRESNHTGKTQGVRTKTPGSMACLLCVVRTTLITCNCQAEGPRSCVFITQQEGWGSKTRTKAF